MIRRRDRFGGLKRFDSGSKRKSPCTKVDGWPAVHSLASLLKQIPKPHRRKIMELWKHSNKKRIRLERLGGEARRAGRGFVIDNTTVVDGLTKRMDDLLKNYDPCALRGDMAFMRTPMESLMHNSSVNRALGGALACDDKGPKCRAIRGDPMKHGSRVHGEVYSAVRHAIRLAKLHRDKIPPPKHFDVDPCTRAVLLSMAQAGLAPFTSEWPAFFSGGSGCATAADVLAIDTRAGYKMTVVELKTGSVVKAMSMPKPGEARWSGMLCAAIQSIATTAMCRDCYGDVLFDAARTNSCILYARPWGCVRIDIPRPLMARPVAHGLLALLADRRGGALRKSLSSRHNEQAHRTTKGTARKRRPKQYKVGFDPARRSQPPRAKK